MLSEGEASLSFLRHTQLQHCLFLQPMVLVRSIRSTYQPWASWSPSEAVEGPCLFLFYCARWLCTGPESCCCCWMCCCSPRQRASPWSLQAKQSHKDMQRTAEAQLGEWFYIQELSAITPITGYCTVTKYFDGAKHIHSSLQSHAFSWSTKETLRRAYR